MAVYHFSFPASAAGLSVTIRDEAGDTVDTVTAGSAAGVQGAVVLTADLPVGTYTATAINAGIYYTSRGTGVLDVPATLAGLEDANTARVADAVDPESETFAEDIVAALVAAGLMAEPEA